MSQDGDAPPPEQNGEQNNEQNGDEDIVTPWTVTSKSAAGIDYNKLIGKPFFESHF